MEKIKTVDVNDFVEMLLSSRDFCNQAYLEYKINDNGIDNISGCIDSKVLNRAIRCAKRNRKIRKMLSDILLYVNALSMTEENFQMLLRFPYKCRSTYLSNICHAELSFYQMKKLNRYPLALEAFTWLFDKICCHDCFNREDMLCILRENPDVKPIVIRDCISSAIKKYGESEKIRVAQAWIDQMEK